MTDFNPNNPYNAWAEPVCLPPIKSVYFVVPSFSSDEATVEEDGHIFEALRDAMPQMFKLHVVEQSNIFGSVLDQEYKVAWYTVDTQGARTLHFAALEDFAFSDLIYEDMAI